MQDSSTPAGARDGRAVSFLAGAGMILGSALTIEHYFAANFPESIWEGSVCDISAFFNCDSSAFSSISAIGGVPLGYFGMVVGILVCLGALFPSPAFERTNRSIALLNAIGVVVLLLVSVLWLGSLCLLCSLYYAFALWSLWLFWRRGRADGRTFLARFGRPSPKHVMVAAAATAVGAWGFATFHDAKEQAQTGAVATRIVEQYYGLPEVPNPSFISPYWVARATDRFEDAPIRVVAYGDLLCSDCRYLAEQLDRLKQEFAGQLNVAFQFFPLDAACNDVVTKDKHPGACELSYIAARDPERFLTIHDEIFADMEAVKSPEGRRELARRHGIEAAIDDQGTRELVHRIIRTGAEYERTHEEYEHGIRSTPTMIVNNRMIIGTLPYEQLRAIFHALVQEQGMGRAFLESWVSE